MYEDYNFMCEKINSVWKSEAPQKPKNEQHRHCLFSSVLLRTKDLDIAFKKKVFIADFYMGIRSCFKVFIVGIRNHFLK